MKPLNRAKLVCSGCFRTYSMIALLVITLTACGGSGGGGSGGSSVLPPPPPPPPQKIYFTAREPATLRLHLFSESEAGGDLTQMTPTFANSAGDVSIFSLSPDGQTIAYSADSDVDNTFELFVVPASGGTPTQVSEGFPPNTRINEIAWSPDSTEVAYVANPVGVAPRGFRIWEVFLADRDGANNRKINGSIGSPPAVAVSGIKWSPDSRYLVQSVAILDPFLALIGFNSYDTTVGGPNSTRITPTLDYLNGERISFAYEWLPNSSRIVYTASYALGGKNELYTSSADGSATIRVSPSMANDRDVTHFHVSPDGSRIAYQSNQIVFSQDDLFVANVLGTDIQRITSRGRQNRIGSKIDLSWSPDSNSVAFSLDDDVTEIYEVYVSSGDGSAALKIHQDLLAGQWARFPTWSPDGQRLTYISNLGGNEAELFATNPDGSNTTTLNGPLPQGGGVITSYWSPDSNRVAYVASQNVAGTFELFVSTADGLTNTQVNTPITAAGIDIDGIRVKWSADSNRVAYYDSLDDIFFSETLDLWVGNIDGSAPVMVNGTNNFYGNFVY